jgi:hypothetical protein
MSLNKPTDELEWLRGLEQRMRDLMRGRTLGMRISTISDDYRALLSHINNRIIELLEAKQVQDEYFAQRFECDGTNCPPRAHDHKVLI